MNSDVMHIFRISEQSQNKSMCFTLEEKFCTPYNSGYSIALRFSQIAKQKEIRR